MCVLSATVASKLLMFSSLVFRFDDKKVENYPPFLFLLLLEGSQYIKVIQLRIISSNTDEQPLCATISFSEFHPSL